MEIIPENIYVLEKNFSKPKKELINNNLLNLNKNEFNCQKKTQKFMDSLILIENFKNDFLTLLFKTKNNNFSKKNINNIINRLFLLYHTDIIYNYYEKSKKKIHIDINKLLINLPNNYKNILLNHNEIKNLPVDIKKKHTNNNISSKTLNKDEIKNKSKNTKYNSNSNFHNIGNANLNSKKTNIMYYLKNRSTILTSNIDNENSDTENSDTENSDTENSDTENTDIENRDTENTDTENRDTENTDTENSYTKNIDTEDSYTKNIDTENSDNEKINNENISNENIDNKTHVTIKKKKVIINNKLKNSKLKNNINKNNSNIKNGDLIKKEKTNKKGNSSKENVVKKKRGRKRKVELNDKFSDSNYITVWPEIWNGQKVLIDMDNHIFTFDPIKPKYIGKKKIDNTLH